MALLGETFHEINDRIFEAPMKSDILLPSRECGAGWEMAEEKKVRGFQV
jgi:hypothetical protein